MVVPSSQIREIIKQNSKKMFPKKKDSTDSLKSPLNKNSEVRYILYNSQLMIHY